MTSHHPECPSPRGKLEELFWEEWFILDGKVHHHILSIKEPVSFEKIYQAPDADEIHPPEVLGKALVRAGPI